MREPKREIEARIEFIRRTVAAAGAKGVVYGNSGGKDSALVGALCRMACPDTLGLILPCASKRNYAEDREDAEKLAAAFDIPTRFIDLTATREALLDALGGEDGLTTSALVNLAPRLRMTALYAVAASENRLVAGTGNRSEAHVGYFTKWGDGASDFNPIADLTVREVYALLRELHAPDFLMAKAPSAGLYDGQTDEAEMGLRYATIDDYLLGGTVSEAESARIEARHRGSEHKRGGVIVYREDDRTDHREGAR